jgi:hypothetical protein
MSLSTESKSVSSSVEKPKHDGAYAAWGLIIFGAISAIPAFILGGRMYAIAALLATTGWVIGALIDRSKR